MNLEEALSLFAEATINLKRSYSDQYQSDPTRIKISVDVNNELDIIDSPSDGTKESVSISYHNNLAAYFKRGN